MAGVSRNMARSLVSSARAAGRFCGTKPAGNAGGERGAAAARGAPRSATGSPCSFSSPKAFSMDTRQPGAFSFFRRLPGEVACVQSLLPLHNATASARMVSQLGFSAGALLQGLGLEVYGLGWACDGVGLGLVPPGVSRGVPCLWGYTKGEVNRWCGCCQDCGLLTMPDKLHHHHRGGM